MIHSKDPSLDFIEIQFSLHFQHCLVPRCELEIVMRVKKLLMVSLNGTLHVHALRLMRRELGLPCDFRDYILGIYSYVFRLVDLEIVALVDWDDELGKARVEE
ncbi:unnamed protein product [Vicia faba]|uniref:PORR domain-containing protein n=1 Tax=Vicia faba TaxID=3906 RepID=A0AAV0YS35_VICFA|nr:unnamed protein product [Vicia faba]